MQFYLEAFTDVATFVIFDPASIQSSGQQKASDLDREMEAAAASGDAIIYSYAGDGDASFRVLVGDRPPSVRLEQRDCGVEGARLRVPSGRIMAAGAEYVWPEMQPPDRATVAEIPPGDYVVDAFDVEWDEDELGAELLTKVSARDVRLWNFGGFLMGLGIFGLLIGLCSIAWSLAEGTWTPLIVAGVMLGVYWAIVIPLLLISPLGEAFDRVQEAQKEVNKKYPGSVVWLRPITNERTFSIGQFGSAYVESSRVEADEPRPSALGCIGSAIALLILCLVVALVAMWVC